MRHRSPLIYTFDIGGRHLRAGVFNEGHTALADTRLTPRSTPHRPASTAAIAEQMQAMFQDLVAQYAPPDAVAVAMNGRLRVVDSTVVRNGPLNHKELIASSPMVSGFNNSPLMEFLESLGWNTIFHVENDANAALRSVADVPTALGINMGNGVAAALKRNNRIQHFDDSWSCYEIGHGLRNIYPEPMMLKCLCGATGCLEAVIGAWGLASRYGIEPKKADIFTYKRMYMDVVTYLTPAIGDAARAANTDHVVLGGGTLLHMGKRFDLLGDIRRQLAQSHPSLDGLEFSMMTTTDTASMHGAALALLDNSVLTAQLVN